MKSAFRVSLLCLIISALTAGGCVQALNGRLALPGEHELVRGQLVFHSDFAVASQHRLLEELIARRADLKGRLGLPVSDEPIHVYLFDDEEEFGTFVDLYHPEFPQRRAFFLETDTRLVVYAQWGDRVAEDLRHEIVHAYLHSAIPNLPLWLDEGLAEYFEVPRGLRGLNRDHLDQLSDRLEKGTWRPDAARLENLDRNLELTLDDYAESWAWVHLMLETPLEGQAILPTYLSDLRRHGSALPISVQLARHVDQPDRALVEHIRGLVGLASKP